jgi:hypothetical protein
MTRTRPPIVFLGPTVSVAEAQAVLPQAEYHAPAERGDLYRARFLGASILVLIDGVFLQSYAPSPRELVDVVRDGARVLGAGSLGALRAAECWPVGMHGAGLIYRLFRAGRLHSDEEVALTYDAQAHRALSVPLVNVRYATHRAVKAGLLERQARDAIVEAAAAIFYTERTWAAVFSLAACEVSAAQQRFLEAIDLKKRDALGALGVVARWLDQDPRLAERHIRRSVAPFAFTEHVREPAADPLAGIAQSEVRGELALWLLTSGRFRRYVTPLIAEGAPGEPPAGPHAQPSATDAESAGTDLIKASRRRAKRAASLAALLADFNAFTARLWGELTLTGERDAELFRFHAVRQMAIDGESPRPIETHRMEVEILAEHGLQTWDELELWADAHGLPREWFRDARDRAARARRRADALLAARCGVGGDPQ